jgi:hypothetical protein
MRNNRKIAAYAALVPCLGLASADGATGERDVLFCAASQAIVCPEQGECTRGLPETANLPRLFRIDLKEHEVVSLKPSGERRTSKILHLAKEDEVYVLQGAESEKGWTATVNERDGRLTITASSSGEAYVVFGVCTAAF